MQPGAVLGTAALLGVYVFCGGLFGACYAVKDVRGWHACGVLSVIAYGLQVSVSLAIVILAPLGPGWKALIAVSTAVYAALPELTVRYLRQLHRE